MLVSTKLNVSRREMNRAAVQDSMEYLDNMVTSACASCKSILRLQPGIRYEHSNGTVALDSSRAAAVLGDLHLQVLADQIERCSKAMLRADTDDSKKMAASMLHEASYAMTRLCKLLPLHSQAHDHGDGDLLEDQ